jgi:hypothetical protein
MRESVHATGRQIADKGHRSENARRRSIGARGPTIRRPLGFLIYVEHFLVPGDQDFCFRLECRAKHQQILRFPSFKLSSSRGFGWT